MPFTASLERRCRQSLGVHVSLVVFATTSAHAQGTVHVLFTSKMPGQCILSCCAAQADTVGIGIKSMVIHVGIRRWGGGAAQIGLIVLQLADSLRATRQLHHF